MTARCFYLALGLNDKNMASGSNALFTSFDLSIGKSRIEGKGAFVGKTIPARKKIGNLPGELISVREARKRAKAHTRISIAEIGNGKAIDATQEEHPLRYINHACTPNTYMRGAFNRIEFYALRRIRPGEELTCNYGPTHHDGKLPCNCGSKDCKGFL
jgi:uncharacterized protein